MKTIGVAIQSYKYGHLVGHCIESLLSQTVKPDKIWVVDDGVGDCEFLKMLYPQIEIIIRPENLGTVANFQDTLYNIVDTDYLMMLGGDNWLGSNAIQELKYFLNDTVLQGSYPDILTYNIIVTGELKTELLNRHGNECVFHKGDIYWDRSSGHHGSMLYNVELAKKVGGYNAKTETGKTEEDWVLYDRMLKAGAKRIHIPQAFLYYRRHVQNYNKYE